MNMYSENKIYIALIHHPVIDKKGDEITSAVTNLDIHDLSRLAKTYGIEKVYIVTPDKRQKELVESIARHWREGFGSIYNGDRKEALGVVKIIDSVESMCEELTSVNGKSPVLVSTCASRKHNSTSFDSMRGILRRDGNDVVIVMGTAWGLADSMFDRSDYVLEPIEINGKYNHLSVRSAASIIVDRLLS